MRLRSNILTPGILYLTQFVSGYNDQHVFNLKTSNDKCLTVTGDRFTICERNLRNFEFFLSMRGFSRLLLCFLVRFRPRLFIIFTPPSQFALSTIKSDVECSSWEQQQFLYSSISNQIISAGGDSSLCLSFSESDEISSKLCDVADLSQVFTSPVSLTNSELTVRSRSCVRLRNLVIFEDFQNSFRPKNRNFQNCPKNEPKGRVGKTILKISIFWPKIILKISKKWPDWGSRTTIFERTVVL